MFLKFRGAKSVKTKATHSTLKRILLSHLQVIGVILALRVPWPCAMISLIRFLSGMVPPAGTMASGLRCLDPGQGSSKAQSIPASQALYATNVVVTIGPVFVAALSYGYWKFLATRFRRLACGAELSNDKMKDIDRVQSVLCCSPNKATAAHTTTEL